MDNNCEHIVRKRSSSDGDILSKGGDIRNIIRVNTNHKRIKVKVAAEDLNFTIHEGYLTQINEDGNWVQYWFVLKEQLLYQFTHPADKLTFDIISLMNCKITPYKEFSEKNFSFEIVGPPPKYESEIFSANTAEDLNKWMKLLQNNLPNDNSSRTSNTDLLQLRKQQFLEEVLEQQEILERKQRRHGCTRQRSMSHDFGLESNAFTLSANRRGLSQLNLASPVDEDTTKDVREVTKLRQRKISTTLKIQSLQQNLNNTEPQLKHDRKLNRISNIFHKTPSHHSLEKKMKDYSNKEDLNVQLNTLKEELQSLESALEAKRGSTFSIDTIDSGQKTKKNKFAIITPHQRKRGSFSVGQSEPFKTYESASFSLEPKKDKNNTSFNRSIKMRNKLKIPPLPDRPHSLTLEKNDIEEKFSTSHSMNKNMSLSDVRFNSRLSPNLVEIEHSLPRKGISPNDPIRSNISDHRKINKTVSDTEISKKDNNQGSKKKFDKFSYEFQEDALAHIAAFEAVLLKNGIKVPTI